MNGRVLVLLICLATPCLGQADRILQGYVYDSQHRPLKDAKVNAGDQARASTLTDSDGHFSLELLPTAKHIRIRVEKDGYTPFDKDLDFTTIALSISLSLLPQNKPVPPPRRLPPGPIPPASSKELWQPTGDTLIDYVEKNLNALSNQPTVTDAQLTNTLSGFFEAPVFSFIGEELPEDALYRFCRTERILIYYVPRFTDPKVRTSLSTVSQNLIYLQDIVGQLYGPVFSAGEQCDKYGAGARDQYKAALGNRVNDRDSLDKNKAQEVIHKMMLTLSSIGMATAPAQSPPSDVTSQSDQVLRLMQDLCQRGVLWEPVNLNYERRDAVYKSVSEIDANTKATRLSLPPNSDVVGPLLEIEIASKTLLESNQAFDKGAESSSGPPSCPFRNALCQFRQSVASAKQKEENILHLGNTCTKSIGCEPCPTQITPGEIR